MARQIEHLGERIADDPGDLGARVQGEQAPSFVVLGEVAAVLDRDRGLAPHPETARDPDRGPRERRRGIPARELPVHDDVARKLLVEARGIGRERGLRVRLRRQRLVVDRDPLRRVLGEVAVLGKDRRDRLPDVADLEAREHRQLRRLIARHARRGPERAAGSLDVGGGHHGRDPWCAGRFAGIDAGDPGMALVAPAECEVQRPGGTEVVHIAAPPGEEAGILEALHARTDEARPELVGGGHSGAPPSLAAAPLPCATAPCDAAATAPEAAAARTARTMCS